MQRSFTVWEITNHRLDWSLIHTQLSNYYVPKPNTTAPANRQFVPDPVQNSQLVNDYLQHNLDPVLPTIRHRIDLTDRAYYVFKKRCEDELIGSSYEMKDLITGVPKRVWQYDPPARMLDYIGMNEYCLLAPLPDDTVEVDIPSDILEASQYEWRSLYAPTGIAKSKIYDAILILTNPNYILQLVPSAYKPYNKSVTNIKFQQGQFDKLTEIAQSLGMRSASQLIVNYLNGFIKAVPVNSNEHTTVRQ